jgi:hypothetical protein
MFVYTMSGGISTAGCASPVIVVEKYPHSYGVGSTVFIKKKAQNKGILEAVVLKKVHRVLASTGIKYVFNYVDTFNRVWLGEELVWQPEAVSLAEAYWQNIADLALTELEKTGCA